MWHWILEHRNAFNDIGLVWLVPALIVLVAIRLIRPGYRRGTAEPIPVRTDEQRAETQKPRSAA
jgi:hypothetical protein